MNLNYLAQEAGSSSFQKEHLRKKEEFKNYIASSYFYTTVGKYDSSLLVCNKALEIAVNLKDTSLLANAFNAKVILFEWRGMLAEAVDLMFDCINLNKSVKNRMGVAYA